MSNLKDFVRLKQVGKGSFGIAWLVESKINSKKYVIKELGHKEMSERERTDARKEVMLLAKMNHPNIVSYLNSFEDGGRVHILMEFCENGDLGARIKAQNGVLFREDQIMDYFVQLCLGIKHIHDNKILHRDIKPQNVFLTRGSVVKLGDFGIAKLMNSTTAFTSTTVGTPFYFSPELCSRRMYNNKSDIWSLGCVLYELCTLNHAFSAQEMAILALRIKNVSYKPISVNYSTGLRNLISTIFQRDPRDRPNINDILKKPFISRLSDKCSSNLCMESALTHSTGKYTISPKTPRVKDVTPRQQSPAISSRVNSGLNNRKLLKKDLIANSPYAPPSKKPMLKKQDNKALVTKKNEIIKKGRDAIINSDRENAWKNVLSIPEESKEDSDQDSCGITPNDAPVSKQPGAYDHFYADLDRLKQVQELREMEAKHLMHRFQKDEDISEGVYRKIDPIKNNIQMGANAADRERLVRDYWENKQRAINNRYRDGAGVSMALCGQRRFDQKIAPPPTPLNHEEEIADRLNKIRQQNIEERKNHNIFDYGLNFDRNKGVIMNRENARLALEDLQRKIKLRSEELQQRLEQKRLEKGNIQEFEQQRKEDPVTKPSNDLQNRGNVILFPKRSEPYDVIPKMKEENNKVQNPRMTNVLEQLHNAKPNEDDVKADASPRGKTEMIKCQEPHMTNILDQLKDVKPSGDEDKRAWEGNADIKATSLSVVLNKIREDTGSPRPTTAPPAEKLEIKKIKTDILKRLNSNKVFLDKVEETPQRNRWSTNFDDNLIKKLDDTSTLDECLINTKPIVIINPVAEIEVQSIQLPPSDFGMKVEPSRSGWSQNKEVVLSIQVDELTDTIVMEGNQDTLKLDLDENILDSISATITVVEPSTTEEPLEDRVIIDEVEEISSTSHKVSDEDDRSSSSTEHVIKFDAWENSFNPKSEVSSESIKEDNKEESEKALSLSSSEDDRKEISVHMRKALEIRSSSSSEDDVSKYNQIEDITEASVDLQQQISQSRSLPDLSDLSDPMIKKAKSESDLTCTYMSGDSSDVENEDFSDEKSDDENIFHKIEMIRNKLETEIGLDPLFDAMDFVRESQDLDGDHIATRLREMLSNNEDAVNNIFHLIVLEEQYNNMD